MVRPQAESAVPELVDIPQIDRQLTMDQSCRSCIIENFCKFQFKKYTTKPGSPVKLCEHVS